MSLLIGFEIMPWDWRWKPDFWHTTGGWQFDWLFLHLIWGVP